MPKMSCSSSKTRTTVGATGEEHGEVGDVEPTTLVFAGRKHNMGFRVPLFLLRGPDHNLDEDEFLNAMNDMINKRDNTATCFKYNRPGQTQMNASLVS
jgi:hypothetical protein